MTDPLVPRMRWWGWGVDGHDAPLPRAATALLRDELGVGGARAEPVALSRVELPAPALDARAARRGSRAAVGRRRGTRRATTTSRASPTPPAAPTPTSSACAADAASPRPTRSSTRPTTTRSPRCSRSAPSTSIAVIPFGGGTSVVGGVDALRGRSTPRQPRPRPPRPAASTSTRAPSSRRSAPARPAPQLERILNERGLTLGHFPQSFEFSTVGGWAATRSAGQASTGYGRIDELVVALRAATPAGELRTLRRPRQRRRTRTCASCCSARRARSASSPRSRCASGRARPQQPLRRLRAARLRRRHRRPARARAGRRRARRRPPLRRGGDARLARALRRARDARARGYLRAYMAARQRPCMAILGFDGDARRRRAPPPTRRARSCARHGAIALGPAPGAAWAKGRFHGAYLRDELLSRGVLRRDARDGHDLDAAHRAARRRRRRAAHGALRERGTPPRRHVPRLAPLSARARRCTSRSSRASSPATSSSSGTRPRRPRATRSAPPAATITHHHAVGRDHAPWLEARDRRARRRRCCARSKERVDPAGVMNPGKLLG